MSIAYLDCYSGISGDMMLGAMIDAGLSLEALRDHLALIDLAGYHLTTEIVNQSSIQGTRLTVVVEQPLDHDHRHWSEIRTLIDSSRLPTTMKATATRIFAALAEAEGAVHGIPADAVHFHEVGAVDSIVDIVGTAIGLELLGITRLYAAPLPLGHGFVRCRHGLLPLPAPATLEVIARSSAATRAVDIDQELVTPTGAAIAATLASFSQPPMHIDTIGYGYGTSQLPWPNALRLWLGHPQPATTGHPGEPTRSAISPGADRLAASEAELLLETNIDDMPGEVFGYLMERLFAAGALDVFYTPIMMKKNRPATKISVIIEAARRAEIEQILLTETTTFGVRAMSINRTKSERRIETVETPYGPVRRKRKEWQGRLIESVPEYDDVAALARQHGLPLRTIDAAARLAPSHDD